MARKIEKLTAEQEAQLVQFRADMWRQGTSCLAADRVMAEAAITEAYRIIGRPAPRFFWMPSPMTCALALYVLGRLAEDINFRDGLGAGLGGGLWAGLWAGLGDGLRAGLRDGLGAGLRDGLGAGLRDGLRAGLRDGLGAGLWAGLRGGLWAGLGDGLRAGLRDGLGAGLRDGLRDGLGDGLWAGLRDGLEDGLEAGLRGGLEDGLWAGLRDGLEDGLEAGLRDGLRDGRIPASAGDTWWWGQMDTFWVCFYRFTSMIGVKQKGDLLSRLDVMAKISASCGFWYPRDGVCVVSDRFASVSWDESRNRAGLPFRLHGEDGPAVSFRDGWGLYYWHGYRLPVSHQWIITDKARLTPDVIENEPNAELRRIMLEVFGFERYLAVREASVVASDELHGQPRRLLEIHVGGEPVRIIEVHNGSLEPDGTRRRFHLGAMLGNTPHDAVAASYGIRPGAYLEAVRT